VWGLEYSISEPIPSSCGLVVKSEDGLHDGGHAAGWQRAFRRMCQFLMVAAPLFAHSADRGVVPVEIASCVCLLPGFLWLGLVVIVLASSVIVLIAEGSLGITTNNNSYDPKGNRRHSRNVTLGVCAAVVPIGALIFWPIGGAPYWRAIG
jgi:hypothetical protein